MSDPSVEAEILIGDDAEKFITSELGRTMIGIAENKKAEAQEKLARVSPWRRRRIAELQNEIWRAESFAAWLGELFVQGKQALQQLKEEE